MKHTFIPAMHTLTPVLHHKGASSRPISSASMERESAMRQKAMDRRASSKAAAKDWDKLCRVLTAKPVGTRKYTFAPVRSKQRAINL